ncbi:MAG: HTTM domain-containing protein [Flavobacteriaceae bacterium]|nr:HTTM domain-containing protein [Flavobacteriaceae bacterium]
MINRFLFKHIDNSALIVFRIIFGLLISLEAFGAILTGWVKAAMIDPQFTFSFIGFEWLQPLPGNWMYAFYALMGVFGIMVMLGYKYRVSIIAYTIMWSATYFMQKSSYNNHYYLLILLCLIMCILPANRYASLDARNNPKIKRISMPNWCSWILILQMWIVYTYASVAKMYPDWIDTSVIELLFKAKSHYFLIGDWLQQKWVHYLVSYAGLAFDLLVIPLLLIRRTRMFAFTASVFFHLFNSFVFQVGIFPYMSLGLCLFFFEPKIIRKLFLKKKPLFTGNEFHVPNWSKAALIAATVYFLIQIGLPLRHWVIPDNVLWTEEGHRLSWRMMLRSRSGIAQYRVVDKATNDVIQVNLNTYLSKKQKNLASTRPDIIWQFVQRLKEEYNEQGKEVEIYVNCHVSINGRPHRRLIDQEIDLAIVEWNAFKHSDWILPSDLNQKKEPNP